MTKYRQGIYKPKHPEKYRGDPTNIIYRSSWELKVMTRFDHDPNVLEWSSEEVVVPYISPVDGKMHRYFLDFFARVKTKDGNIVEYLIEVKPKDQLKPPEPRSSGLTKRYLQEVFRYGVNEAKWLAATTFAKKKGWEFKILTEDNLSKW